MDNKIKNPRWTVLFKSYAITFTAVGIAFSIQYFYVLDKHVEIKFLIAPSFVALVLGTFLAYFNHLRYQLKQSNEQFRAVVDIAEEFIYYRDLSGTYKYVSPSCENLTGYPAEYFYQNPHFMNTLIHEKDRQIWMTHVHNINEACANETLDIRIVHKSGEIKWMKHVCAPVNDATGKQIGVRSSNIDITEQKNHENQIFSMAYYDPLTSLPNRRLFEQNLESMIEKANDINDIFSVMFLDLDRFKNINDSFGHKLGDKVLVAVTQLVLESCKNKCLVSRFGGDEFVLICSDIETVGQAEKFASEMIKKIEQPIFIDDVSIYISASIGVAFYPDDGEDMSTLIRNADTAMYKSKKDVASKVLFYNAEFGDEATHFISTEHSIHKALDAREFVPYYQPKVDMSSGKIIGAEALARWINPEQGIIMPSKFISVAEETSQIVDIGKQITEKVLKDMTDWKTVNCAIPVSINVSVRQFSNNSYFSELVELLKSYNIKPEDLEIEITEQVFLGDLVMAKRRLNEFRSSGFKIALDDFGTGYSSMSYLHELPIDILKIDKSFVSNIGHDEKSLAIMKAISSLSRDLKYEMIAEGVENETQKNILLGMDCIDAQGYYFHKPMPQAELTDLLIEQISDTLNKL